MVSPVIVTTAIASAIGLVLNSLILFLVLRHAKHRYHYLFAGILLTCAIWDLGILLTMIRNQHPNELIVYGYIATIPGIFIPALVHHFSITYSLKQPGWSVWLVWALTIPLLFGPIFGFYGKLEDVYHYSWGSIFQLASSGMPAWLIITFWLVIMGASLYILSRGWNSATRRIDRRHFSYIIAGFTAITIAVVKVVVIMRMDVPWVLPLGMILNDTFAALIGVAIIKEKLLDITLIVKRGAIYSGLAASIIFIFSFSEHILANYLGELIGGHSQVIHLVSIAVVIGVLMPIKHRLEAFVNRSFRNRQVQF
jgi:hypothetical protein